MRAFCLDVPGFARERLQEKEPVFQVYFTGCAGDVVMGKCNDGTGDVFYHGAFVGLELTR